MKNKIVLALVVIVALLFSMTLGWGIRDDSLKCEAVRLGHAEWVSDIDGHPEFKWKDTRP